MAQYVFTMNRVGKVVPPKRQILKDISLSFFPGAKIGLLGLNGAGKSTVLKIMAGLDREIEGEATPMPGIKIGYLPQEPQLEPGHSVREAVEEGVGEVLGAKTRLDEVYAAYAEPDADFDKLAAEQERLEKVLESADVASLEAQLEIAADALRLPPWDAQIDKLSGGEKRRVALCRLLVSKPDMLLLDEPTNHLDAESVDWLEQFLSRYPGTVVAVTHDRYFLDNAAEWILELDRGRGIPWEGNYSSWLEQKRDRLKQEESSESARQRALKKELEWVRQNAKGQTKKSKARLLRFEELNSYEYQKRNETSEIFIPVGERLGNECIEFVDVTKSYGDRCLIDNLSFKVPPGAIVGIIGPNGAGKSTIFRMITGREKPDSGEVKVGHTVQLAYVDQSRDSLPDKKNAWEAISDGQDILTIGKFEIQSRAYLGRFNFKGQDQQKLVGNLSGRRARAAAPRQDAPHRRQRAAPGRTLQRPRRRDAARPRGCALRIRRQRDGDFPRPLVPRPDLHAHPRGRGRVAVVFLPGQLSRVRGEQARAPGRGGGRTAPPALQGAQVTAGTRSRARPCGPSMPADR